MAIVSRTPAVDALGEAVDALREWQFDGAPMQLHPGDVGWFWRFGAEATAAAVRTWSQDGRILAVGLLDGPGLLRLTTAPDALRERGSSSAIVCTPSANAGAVATYRSAGFQRLLQVRDLFRDS